MTKGVGGSTAVIELAKLTSQRDQAVAIGLDEYQQRIDKVCAVMLATGIDALYLDATTSLRYFTGLQCYASERLHGAIISAHGEVRYVVPAFEQQKILASLVVEGDFVLWEEHEDPTAAVARAAMKLAPQARYQLAIDSQTPFYTASRLQAFDVNLVISNAEELIASFFTQKCLTRRILQSEANVV